VSTISIRYNIFAALAWHPVHECLFASGGSDGSIMYWMAK